MNIRIDLYVHPDTTEIRTVNQYELTTLESEELDNEYVAEYLAELKEQYPDDTLFIGYVE